MKLGINYIWMLPLIWLSGSAICQTGDARPRRLHVLTIGIDDYGEKARELRPTFASRDASALAAAPFDTQENGIYWEIQVQRITDREADRATIFMTLDAMKYTMEEDDVAVIMFAGQSVRLDNQFYYLPYGVDLRSAARIKASAIPSAEIENVIRRLADRGRVLVLLDVCHYGGPLSALSALSALSCPTAASISLDNVTVMTPSVSEPTLEDDGLHHSAFTKVLLDALSPSAFFEIDTDHNKLISVSELAEYVAKNLSAVTGGQQQLGLNQRFQGDIFVSGLR
jgi:hypothetical protein